MEKTVVEYGGIEIEYLEDVNKWRFELRGRERKADSLKAAKEAIDKPDPKEKSSFQPIEGWVSADRWDSSSQWEKVKVTSIAEGGRYGTSNVEVWIVKNGKRKREYASKIHADTPANAAIREEVARLD